MRRSIFFMASTAKLTDVFDAKMNAKMVSLLVTVLDANAQLLKNV
jgi:hypothetical protein